jgi:hypothetical protein
VFPYDLAAQFLVPFPILRYVIETNKLTALPCDFKAWGVFEKCIKIQFLLHSQYEASPQGLTLNGVQLKIRYFF